MKPQILLLFITVILAALSAQAHTVLSSSIPAENSVETTTPKNITLEFSTEVRLAGLSVEDGNGKNVDLGATPPTMQQKFAIPASEISPGTYLVKWRAVGADMHIVSGEFQFVVAELISRK